MARFSHHLTALTPDDQAGLSVLLPSVRHPLGEATATLRGRVVRWDRAPLVGAVLSVIDGKTRRVVLGGFSGLGDQQRRPDSSGRFELPGVPPGTHQLLVQPMASFGGINDGHHGLPTTDSIVFKPVTVELPALEAGDAKDIGDVAVSE